MYLKKESRAKLGKKMDDYMRENIQNEEIFWSVGFYGDARWRNGR